MDIIILYGPPASGKYTVGKKLSEKLNYKLFHNHLILDPLKEILDTKNKRFWEFTKKIRLQILNEAKKEKIKGAIVTIAYTGNEDELIKKITSLANKHLVVKLETDIKTIKERIKNSDRKNFAKIVKLEDLENWMEKYDIDATYKNSFIIKSNNKSVEEILKKWELK